MWEGRGRGGALRNYGGSGVVEKGKGCGRRGKSRTWRIPSPSSKQWQWQWEGWESVEDGREQELECGETRERGQTGTDPENWGQRD